MDISWISGNARVNFHHAEQTLALPLKKHAASIGATEKQHPNAASTISLLELCKAVTPPCRLNPFLFNGHLQTLYTVIRQDDIPIQYKRRIFTSDDDNYAGTFAVDFVCHTLSAASEPDPTLAPRTHYYTEAEWQDFEKGGEDTTPMLIALHGLSGGSHELYLRHVLAPLVLREGKGEQGWEALVVNARGCANSKITSPVLFNARATWDVRQVVKWLKVKWPKRPLFAAGFSLGGNILVNYLGEEGPNCLLTAAVVCSNPWDLHAGSLALQRSWIGKELYSKHMADGMRRLFESHVHEISKGGKVDAGKVRQTRYLHDFDREVQGPTWGYPTEGAYYRDASSTEPLLAVSIPLFAVHAEDDPVAPKEALPFQEITQNPRAVLCTTSLGGHLSWFESGGGRWYVKPVVGFLRKMAQEVDLEVLHRHSSMKSNKSFTVRANGSAFDPMRRKLYLVP